MYWLWLWHSECQSTYIWFLFQLQYGYIFYSLRYTCQSLIIIVNFSKIRINWYIFLFFRCANSLRCHYPSKIRLCLCIEEFIDERTVSHTISRCRLANLYRGIIFSAHSSHSILSKNWQNGHSKLLRAYTYLWTIGHVGMETGRYGDLFECIYDAVTTASASQIFRWHSVLSTREA